MNQLAVDGRGRVVFDAGDALVVGEQDDEEDEQEEGDVEDLLQGEDGRGEQRVRVRWAEGEGDVGLERLRRECYLSSVNCGCERFWSSGGGLSGGPSSMYRYIDSVRVWPWSVWWNERIRGQARSAV